MHIQKKEGRGGVNRGIYPPRHLLSCTYCSSFLITTTIRNLRVCLKQLGTEYVQLWSTLFYQGAHTPKQEGRGCVKRGWNSPKGSAFLHILLSITYLHYWKVSKSVLEAIRNWVCAALEHFPLPRCTYKKRRVPDVWRKAEIPLRHLLFCTSC